MILNEKIKLNGSWFYKTDADSKLDYESVRRLFLSGKIKDEMRVPSNWQLAGLNNFSGAVWFIKKFNVSEKFFAKRIKILKLKGKDYIADIWLNKSFVRHHEGYFQTFNCDIGKFILKQNLLVVKITSPFEEPGKVWPLKKKLIKGIFNHHDCRPGAWDPKHGQDQNTGGIWNDVLIESADGVWLESVRLDSKINYAKNYADVNIKADYLSALSKSVKEEIVAEVLSPDGKIFEHRFNETIKPGMQTFKISFEINNPFLWWSWDIGKPDLYRIKISSKLFDDYKTTFGIREVKLDDEQIFYLNGKRLFLRGTNIIPTQFLSDLTKKKIEKQVTLIREAKLNVVRVHAHVNRDEFYDECDKQGILVWQDFALQWTYDDSEEFAKNAVTQIKEMVRQHYNHPSISFWCCHNEPGKQIETLDKKLFNAAASEDKTRVIRIASNYEEHAYDGWYWGDKEHYAAAPMGPLVTEFGAQGIPEISSLKKILSLEDIRKPNWEKWKYHNFQYEQTFQIAGVQKGKNTHELIRNSQNYQAELLQTAIDSYRRKRFNGINGIFQFMMIDCWQSITWSVVDYYFKKKKAYFALQKTMQPVYVSVRVRQKKYFAGAKLNIDCWLINDLHESFSNCKLAFDLNGKIVNEMEMGTVTEDSIRFIDWESIHLILPKNLKAGKHSVEIFLKSDKKILTANNFEIEIERDTR